MCEVDLKLDDLMPNPALGQMDPAGPALNARSPNLLLP